MGTHHSLLGKSVQVGSFRLRVTSSSENVGSMLIGHQKENVWRRGNDDQGQGQQQWNGEQCLVHCVGLLLRLKERVVRFHQLLRRGAKVPEPWWNRLQFQAFTKCARLNRRLECSSDCMRDTEGKTFPLPCLGAEGVVELLRRRDRRHVKLPARRWRHYNGSSFQAKFYVFGHGFFVLFCVCVCVCVCFSSSPQSFQPLAKILASCSWHQKLWGNPDWVLVIFDIPTPVFNRPIQEYLTSSLTDFVLMETVAFITKIIIFWNRGKSDVCQVIEIYNFRG